MIRFYSMWSRFRYIVYRDVLWITALFVLSRVVAYMAGIRFMSSPLFWFWQYLPVSLLSDHLFESILFLHMQPPLFNLFLGVILSLFPYHAGTVFHLLFCALGYATVLLMHTSLIKLGIQHIIRRILIVLFIISPAALGYEHWLFYPHMLAFLFMAAVFFLLHASVTDRTRLWIFFLLTCAVITLTRALYHPVWFFTCCLICKVVSGMSFRRLLRIAWLPATLVLLVLGKNSILFHTPTLSSWTGMNCARVSILPHSPSRIDSLINEDVLTHTARIRPFAPAENYLSLFSQKPHANADAVTMRRKKNGHPNYNHWVYRYAGPDYFRDAMTLARLYPRAFLSQVAHAWYIYFLPSSYNSMWEENLTLLSDYAKHYNRIWGVGFISPAAGGFLFYLCMCISVTLAIIRPRFFPHRVRVLVLFVCGSILFSSLIMNTCEIGENNRFKYALEPAGMLILGWWFGLLWEKTSPLGASFRGRSR